MKKYYSWLILAALIIIVVIMPKPLEISPTASVTVTILLGLALVWVLVLTIRGHLIGRRVVFLFIGASLTLPFFMNFEMPIKVSPEVKILYDALAKLPPGSKVLAAFDYDPPSAPELQPQAEAFMAYAFKHDLKVIIMGLWPQGPQQANMAVAKVLQQPEIRAKNLRYGVDYVNLGFQSGNEFVIQRMGTSFSGMFPRDIYNTDYSAIPLLNGVENFSNIDFVFNLSSGYPGTVEWVQIAVDRYGVKVGAGNTAVQAPSVYPYLSSHKLTGLAGGMSGAWQLEQATQEPGKASTYVLPQTFSHMVVIAFLVIGNAALMVSHRKSKQKGA